MKSFIVKLVSITIIPLYLIILALRPVIKIRVGNIYSSRIGHLCELHHYIILKKNTFERSIDFISFSKPISNIQLLNQINKEKNYYEIPEILGKLIIIFLNLINDKDINLDCSGKFWLIY